MDTIAIVTIISLGYIPIFVSSIRDERQGLKENTLMLTIIYRACIPKVYGQLVLLGFDVTAFTPAAYQRSSLLRPLKQISS